MSESGKYDPRRRIELSLPEFDSVAADERPAFIYRRTTADEWDQASEALYCEPPEQLKDEDPAAQRERYKKWLEQYRRDIFAALAIGLVGFKNQIFNDTEEIVTSDSECSVETLRRLINAPQAVQLLGLRVRGGQVTAAEKKGSVSPN